MVAACSTALQLLSSVDETRARTTSKCEEDLEGSRRLRKKRAEGAQKKLGSVRPQRLHRLLPEGDSGGESHLMRGIPSFTTQVIRIVTCFWSIAPSFHRVPTCLSVGRIAARSTVLLKRKTWSFVWWICLWPALRPRPPRCAGLSSTWRNTPRSKVEQNMSFQTSPVKIFVMKDREGHTRDMIFHILMPRKGSGWDWQGGRTIQTADHGWPCQPSIHRCRPPRDPEVW